MDTTGTGVSSTGNAALVGGRHDGKLISVPPSTPAVMFPAGVLLVRTSDPDGEAPQWAGVLYHRTARRDAAGRTVYEYRG